MDVAFSLKVNHYKSCVPSFIFRFLFREREVLTELTQHGWANWRTESKDVWTKWRSHSRSIWRSDELDWRSDELDCSKWRARLDEVTRSKSQHNPTAGPSELLRRRLRRACRRWAKSAGGERDSLRRDKSRPIPSIKVDYSINPIIPKIKSIVSNSLF